MLKLCSRQRFIIISTLFKTERAEKQTEREQLTDRRVEENSNFQEESEANFELIAVNKTPFGFRKLYAFS